MYRTVSAMEETMIKYSYDSVNLFFKERGCILLTKKEDYINIGQSLKYECSCGNISSIRLAGKFKPETIIHCRDCSRKTMEENNLKKYGVRHTFQLQEIKEKIKATHVERLGVENPNQSLIIKEKRKQTCLKKYGTESALQSGLIKEKIRRSNLLKYGVEYNHQRIEVREKFLETIRNIYGVPNLAYLSRPASKQSQKLFWAIYNLLNEEEKMNCYFAELNHEFYHSNKYNCYKYDFVLTKNKIVIEYNGFNFHPKDFQDDNEIGWCAFHPEKTVGEAREYEKNKFDLLKNKGYTFMVVWDYEYKQFESLVTKCFNFIKENVNAQI